MKKIAKVKILIICLLSISFISKGQTVGGIKGGVNLSNMFVDEVDDENMKVGFNVGFFVRSDVSNLLSIQPEINFTTKGSKIDYNYVLGQGETSFNFNYLEVPILLCINLGDAFRIQAGPYAGFLLGGNVVNDADDNLFDFDNKINKDDFNKVDFGLSGGIEFGAQSFSLGARFNYGLNEIGKDDNFYDLSYNLRNAHHAVTQVYVAFAF